MHRELILAIIEQNEKTSLFCFKKITHENAKFRLNAEASSVGFILRHIAETLHLFGSYWGIPTAVQGTTMKQTDIGQGDDFDESMRLIEQAYENLKNYIKNSEIENWLESVEVSGVKASRIRPLLHILFHTSHHVGQISLTLSKGKNISL